MIIRSYIYLILALLIAGCQNPAITSPKPYTPKSVLHQREQLVGTWFGDQPTINGGRQQWIMQRFKDGTFRVTFRLQDDIEGTINQTEVGIWNVNDTYLVAVTRGWVEKDGNIVEVSIADSYLWDVYQIISISSDDFYYKGVESGNEFHVKRVPDGFRFQNIAEPASLLNSDAAPLAVE